MHTGIVVPGIPDVQHWLGKLAVVLNFREGHNGRRPNEKKIWIYFMLWRAECSLWKTESFPWSLKVFRGGVLIYLLQFLSELFSDFFFAIFNLKIWDWIRILILIWIQQKACIWFEKVLLSTRLPQIWKAKISVGTVGAVFKHLASAWPKILPVNNFRELDWSGWFSPRVQLRSHWSSARLKISAAHSSSCR